jgi:hypothetical protein
MFQWALPHLTDTEIKELGTYWAFSKTEEASLPKVETLRKELSL